MVTRNPVLFCCDVTKILGHGQMSKLKINKFIEVSGRLFHVKLDVFALLLVHDPPANSERAF